MRGVLSRVEYPAVRDMLLTTATAETPPPNCWSLEHDEREWVRQGKGFSMYKNERSYYTAPKSASATDFYNTDQAAKQSAKHPATAPPAGATAAAAAEHR